MPKILRTSLLVGLVGIRLTVPSAGTIGAQSASERTDVSLIQLIATPERFDGKSIRVIGFLHLEFEGTVLYLHETDFCHTILNNALWVSVGWPPDEKHMKWNNTYVLLEGVFSSKSKGHYGMFAGSIQSVSRLIGFNVDAEPRRCSPERYAQANRPLQPTSGGRQ